MRVSVDGMVPHGTLKFYGESKETGKLRCGVEFDEPVEKGRGGTFKGHEYFKSAPKTGLLCVPSKVTLLAGGAGGGSGIKGLGPEDPNLMDRMMGEMGMPVGEEPVSSAPAGDDLDGMGRLQLVKKCREKGLDYKAISKDVEALKALLRSSN